MIPTYDDLLDAIAAAFKVPVATAERWLMIHLGNNIINAANEPG